jgi:transcriptional antiterminator Rof (Rho-off)
MPQETKSMPADLLAKQHSVAGWSVDLKDDAATFDVLEKAFDYRGDVALTLKDGKKVDGYLFDRRKGKGLADSTVRLMGAASDEKITVKYADIAHIAFSDRDPAAGKSFETWVKKYIEKKMAGEKASIESETLD